MSSLRSLVPFVLLMGIASTAPSQELGVFASAGRSDDEQVGDPTALGIRATWFPLRYVGLRFDYARYESRGRWPGITFESCHDVLGCIDPVDENLENDFELTAFEYALVVPARAGDWRIEATLGIAKLQDRYEVRGTQTGRIVARSHADNAEDPISAEFDDVLDLFGKGYNAHVYGLGVTREGIRSLPIVVGLEWRRRVNRERYGAPSDSRYWPSWYSDRLRVDEARLHASWSF